MGDKDEQRKQGEQDETPEVEGHGRFLNEQEPTDEDEQKPDVEGHEHIKSPVREHIKGRF